MLLQERRNAVRRLGALANPVVDALEVHPEIFLVVAADRVEEANSLDVAAITAITRIGDNHVIERTLFRASARKSNANHYISVLVQRKADTPYLGPTRVDGALYGFYAKSEAFCR